MARLLTVFSTRPQIAFAEPAQGESLSGETEEGSAEMAVGTYTGLNPPEGAVSFSGTFSGGNDASHSITAIFQKALVAMAAVLAQVGIKAMFGG